jgi:glycosyltransferase involved in cell wall biosynthesis
MGVLDAWAYGIPCVVTPVGGLPDIVIDGYITITA